MHRIIYSIGLALAVCVTAVAQDGTLKEHSPAIQQIFKTDKGVFRGFDFGTKASVIKQVEAIPPLLEKNDALLYQLELQHETVDIIYYINEATQQVEGFGIAILVEDYNEENRIMDDLKAYFTERYGEYTVKAVDDDKVWYSEAGDYRVEMGDSSDEDILEVEIEIQQGK